MDQLSGENSAFAAHLPPYCLRAVMKAMRHNARASHAISGRLFSRAINIARSPVGYYCAKDYEKRHNDTAYSCSARSPGGNNSSYKTTMPATPMARPPAPKRSIWSGAKSAPAKKIAPNSTHVPATTRAFAPNPLWARSKPSIRKRECQHLRTSLNERRSTRQRFEHQFRKILTEPEHRQYSTRRSR